MRLPYSLPEAVLLLLSFLIFSIASLLTHAIMWIFYWFNRDRSAIRTLYYFSYFAEFLTKAWGTSVSVESNVNVYPKDKSIIFVCNHHSSLDIIILLNRLPKLIGTRKLAFITRKGLDRGLPAISLYIRKYCYTLKGTMDKRNRSSLTKAYPITDQELLPKFSKSIQSNSDAVIIFPEGVKPYNKEEYFRRFQRNGLRILIDENPDAVIVPISIKGSGDFYTTPKIWTDLLKVFPKFFRRIDIVIANPIDGANTEEKIDRAERQVLTIFNRLRDNPLLDDPRIVRKNKWIH